jgi:hypothetical protein
VTDDDARLRLARELARRKASVRSVVRACHRVADELGRRRLEAAIGSGRRRGQLPSLAIAEAVMGEALPPVETKGTQEQIRQAARQACGACDIKQDLLDHVAEPAWRLVKRAAGETCDLCSLKDVLRACHGCPLPEFLVRMARMADRQQEEGGP